MLALSGLAMVIAFMALIMTKRTTAIVALILVPLAFAVLGGQSARVGEMFFEGVLTVAPTAIMLMFAILFFGVMIDAGLFEPLVNRITAWTNNDPLRVTIGHTALACIVALDGDGTTTILVTASAMLPIYRKLGMNVLIFGVLGGLCSTLLNLSPWGGPAARVAASLQIDPASLFLPLLPAILISIAATFGVAVWLGLGERRRLGYSAGRITVAEDAPKDETAKPVRHPGRLLINLLLTIGVMVCVVMHLAPLAAIFMVGTALALTINFPKLADQRERIAAHGGNVVNVAGMVLAAGCFTGILSGMGMSDAMAQTVTTTLPPDVGPYLAPITALLSIPMTFFLSNDAFYFGILPVLSEAAQTYGISPEEIGRASLLGQPVHGLSPLVAALYFKCAVMGVEVADVQRFALKYALLISLVLIAAALLTGAIPFIRI